MKCRSYLLLMAFAGIISTANAAEQRTVSSPSGTLSVTVTYTDDQQLQYTVAKGSRSIIDPSGLGVTVGALTMQKFSRGVEWETSAGVETYKLSHGKVSEGSDAYTQLVVNGLESAQRGLTVRFRVFDDAVAFRYEIPSRRDQNLINDLSEFNFNTFTKAWVQDYEEGYSSYYNSHIWADLTNQGGYSAPMLIQAGANYILLTEAGVYGQMAGSRIYPGSDSKQIRLVPEGGTTLVSNFTSPWRTMLIGTLPAIVESTTMYALCEENRVDDWADWVQPGISSWDWGSEDGSNNVTLDRCKWYIDLASSMGWPYFLLDEGWDGRVSLGEVCDYAAGKGVRILLWSHQNRFNNDYNYNYDILKSWADAGIAGTKIDFFEGDAQQVMQKYQVLLQASADLHLMMNFHGCKQPTGTERTWPHLMTMESNYGGEMYMFWGHLTPAKHGVNLAVARNVLGSMDYTPVKYGKRDGCAIANTSWAYQTALTTLFETGYLTICDCPSNLLGRESTPLLRQVPTRWDEIHCLGAVPESYVAIARRDGSDWWLSAISESNRSCSFDLSFLDDDRTYYAYIYRQGVHATDIDFEKREVTSKSRISHTLKSQDGIIVCITPDNDRLYPQTIRREAESYLRGVDAQSNSWCSQGRQAKPVSGNSASVTFDDIEVADDGRYTLTFFYTNEEASQAAISVNGGEAQYHTFAKAGGESSHDPLGFATIMVDLKAGTNTIKFASVRGAQTPALDRILLMREVHDDPEFEPGGTGYAGTDVLEPRMSSAEGMLKLTVYEDGMLSIFATDGTLLLNAPVHSGYNCIDCSSISANMVIASVRSGSASFAKKMCFF